MPGVWGSELVTATEVGRCRADALSGSRTAMSSSWGVDEAASGCWGGAAAARIRRQVQADG